MAIDGSIHQTNTNGFPLMESEHASHQLKERIMNHPTAEDFSTKIYEHLIDNDPDGGIHWDCHVSPDEVMHFTDSQSGGEWTVAIDDEDDPSGETMWVNLCKGGTMTPDFDAVEFDSIGAAVIGVGDWILDGD